VHRDLKPANIFVVESGGTSNFVKVLDFGIAKSLHQISDDHPKSLTNTGIIVGTPFYMAPEQASGMTSRSADLYALGVILYQCLAGKRPFTGSSPVEVIMQHMNSAPPPLSKKVPERLRNLVEGLMAKQPTDRPRSAKAVLEALQQIGNGHLRSDSHDTVVDVILNVANIETADIPQVNPHSTGDISEMTPLVSRTVSSLKDPDATTQALTPEETVTAQPGRPRRLQGLWIPAGLVLIAIATTSFTIHRIREHRSPNRPAFEAHSEIANPSKGDLLSVGPESTPRAKAIPAAIPAAPPEPKPVEAAGVAPPSDPEETDTPIQLHKLSVFTLPPNAKVQIRLAKAGAGWSEPLKSPLEIKVQEGTYDLRIIKVDYKVRRMKLDVSSERKVHLKLRPDLGDL
jgi:serine/threonine-protein kinase